MSRWTVIQQAAALVYRRVRARISTREERVPLAAWNLMFERDLPCRLAREKLEMELLDLELFARLNSPRLAGQIVFEYGVLVNYVADWNLNVLDIGSGASSFPRWMSERGASVVSFDYPEPIEAQSQGKRAALNRWLSPSKGPGPRRVGGDMLHLPFANEVFDLVCSFSVIEHVDTNLPDRAYVAYPEQKRRAKRAVAEMVRTVKPGGLIYLTSECCDFARASEDRWKDSYYFDERTKPSDAPRFSGAWPIEDVSSLFYEHLSALGCRLIGENRFDPGAIDQDAVRTFRGRFFSAFSVLAQR